MTEIQKRSPSRKIFLALWPLLAAAAVFSLPLGWVLAIIIFLFAVWLLVATPGLSATTKSIIGLLWVASGIGVGYCLTAFGTLVDAADRAQPDPAWATGLPFAFLAAIFFMIAAAIITLRTSHR